MEEKRASGYSARMSGATAASRVDSRERNIRGKERGRGEPIWTPGPGGFGFHRFFSLFYISMKIPEKDSRNYFMAGSQEHYIPIC